MAKKKYSSHRNSPYSSKVSQSSRADKTKRSPPELEQPQYHTRPVGIQWLSRPVAMPRDNNDTTTCEYDMSVTVLKEVGE